MSFTLAVHRGFATDVNNYGVNIMKNIIIAAASALGLALSYGAVAGPSTGYATCAAHGANCGKGGASRMVRYGWDGNWAEKEIKGEIPCLPENFEGATVTGKPFAGVSEGGVPEIDKRCEEM